MSNTLSTKQKSLLAIILAAVTWIFWLGALREIGLVLSNEPNIDIQIFLFMAPITLITFLSSTALFKGIYKKEISVFWKLYAGVLAIVSGLYLAYLLFYWISM